MLARTLPTKNVQRLMEAAELLTLRSAGLPGIGLVSGDTGLGKSSATAWLVCQVNGIFVTADPDWTTVEMYKTILAELDIAPCSHKASPLMRQVAEALFRAKRPLFIDEADDFAGSTKMVESIRRVQDFSKQPVILIGYKGLDKRLARFPMFTSRVLQHVRFEPADFDDAKLLAKGLMQKVQVGEDLLRRVHEQTSGNIRQLLVGLARIEHFGAVRGLEVVNSADWGSGEEFFTGGAQQGARANVTAIGAGR